MTNKIIFYTNKYTGEHGKRVGRTPNGEVIVASPTIKMGGQTLVKACHLRKHWKRTNIIVDQI